MDDSLESWDGSRTRQIEGIRCLLLRNARTHLGLNYPAFPSGAKKVKLLCTVRNSNTRPFVAFLRV